MKVYDDQLDLGFTHDCSHSQRSSINEQPSNLIDQVMRASEDDNGAEPMDVEKANYEATSEDDAAKQNPMVEFLYSICPVDLLQWEEMSLPNRMYEVVKSPVMFLIQATTPLVDYDRPLNGWSRILNSLQCILAPLFWMFTFKMYSISLGGVFPLWIAVLTVACIMAIVVFATSKHWEPPRYHPVFAFFGFITAIVWIYTLANEVVNVLETLGLVFNISIAILGVTLLAWANSIGDVISNVVLARQGFPRIAISACFGGPLFNLLLGFGVPFLIKTIQEGGEIDLNVSLLQVMLTGFVMGSLVISLIAFPLMNFHIRKPYGFVLISFYLVFLILAILTEMKVIEAIAI